MALLGVVGFGGGGGGAPGVGGGVGGAAGGRAGAAAGAAAGVAAAAAGVAAAAAGARAVPSVVGRAVLGPAVEVDPVIDAAIDAALAKAELVARAVPIDRWKAAWAAQQRLLVEEAWHSDHHLLEIDGGAGISDEIRARLIVGSGIDAATLEADRVAGETWTAELSGLVGRHGILALPTLGVRPPRLDEFGGGFNVLTAPVNLAGFPAISLPVPVDEPNRPAAGLQLVGLPGTEGLLCATAAKIEAAVAN
jgi:amidase